jgi:ATP-dependent Lon protease
VRTAEKELFKARSRDQGSVKIIDIVRARLDTRSDSHVAEVPSLAIRDAQIDDDLVRSNERMLTDGFYAEVSLEYDPVIAQERNGRPFRIAALRPVPHQLPWPFRWFRRLDAPSHQEHTSLRISLPFLGGLFLVHARL